MTRRRGMHVSLFRNVPGDASAGASQRKLPLGKAGGRGMVVRRDDKRASTREVPG